MSDSIQLAVVDMFEDLCGVGGAKRVGGFVVGVIYSIDDGEPGQCPSRVLPFKLGEQVTKHSGDADSQPKWRVVGLYFSVAGGWRATICREGTKALHGNSLYTVPANQLH